MDYESILNKVEALVEPIIAPLGFELIEREIGVEQGRQILRLYIDRTVPGNVSIEDCETISRAVEAPLDVADLIPGSYTLEVSSPGLDRPLRKPKDFERFVGSRITVKTRQDLESNGLKRRHFTGLLKGLEQDTIILLTDGQEWRIPLHLLAKARIKPQFEGVKHGKG